MIHRWSSSHMAEGERDLSGTSFIRAPIPFMRAPTSLPNYPLKVPSPNTITMGIRFPHMNWGEGNKYPPFKGYCKDKN